MSKNWRSRTSIFASAPGRKIFYTPEICRECAFGAPLISALTKTVMELEFFNVTRFKDIFSLFLKNCKCDKKKVDIFDCVMHLKHDSAKWGYFSSFQICKPFFKDIYLCFLINFSLNWYSWSFLLRERKFVFFTFFPDFFGFYWKFSERFRLDRKLLWPYTTCHSLGIQSSRDTIWPKISDLFCICFMPACIWALQCTEISCILRIPMRLGDFQFTIKVPTDTFHVFFQIKTQCSQIKTSICIWCQ